MQISTDKKRFFSNVFSLSMLQIFSYILPLLTFPYLVRTLGIDKFGLVVFAQAFLSFFIILVDYGFNLSATREIAKNRDERKKVTEIFSAVLFIKMMLALFAFIILTLLIVSFEKFTIEWQLYYFSFLAVIGNALFPVWYFQGIEKMKYITFINISVKIIFTILIFLVIQEPSDYIYVPILNGLGFIISGIIALVIIFKILHQEFVFQNFIIYKKYFQESSQFFLSRISVTLYTSANVFILGLVSNITMVGYYSIAEKLYLALVGLYQPIVQALYPYMAKEKNLKLFKKVFFSIVVINSLGILFVYNLEVEIFHLLFSTSIGDESIRVFNHLLIAGFIIVPSILLGYPFLGALGFSNYANKSVIYGSLTHILGLSILNIFNVITIYSVASMVVITELIVLSSRIYWIKRNLL